MGYKRHIYPQKGAGKQSQSVFCKSDQPKTLESTKEAELEGLLQRFRRTDREKNRRNRRSGGDREMDGDRREEYTIQTD